jgi:hypothetical protein
VTGADNTVDVYYNNGFIWISSRRNEMESRINNFVECAPVDL